MNSIILFSAGAGRTGALIAYDILLEEAASLSSIDVYNRVLKMRQQRVDMVQTSVRHFCRTTYYTSKRKNELFECIQDQYILVHKLVLENHLFGVTEISSSGISSGEVTFVPTDEYLRIYFIHSSAFFSRNFQMEKEFKNLTEVEPIHRIKHGNPSLHKHFNRCPDTIPCRMH